jgi:hypothetical protein
MNTTTWILQAILATVFTGSGLFILFNKEKLSSKLSWLKEFSPAVVAFICLSKVVGAIGLILPMLTGILPILTPFAAIGIATIMALAFSYHIRKKEYKDIPATIIFFSIAIFIAINRF